MEKRWKNISIFLCRSSLIEALKRPGEKPELKRETDFKDHQFMLDFLLEPNPKAHKKEVMLSNGTVFRRVFPMGDRSLPTSPEKTKAAAAAAAETSKEDGLATGSEKAGTNAEKITAA